MIMRKNRTPGWGCGLRGICTSPRVCLGFLWGLLFPPALRQVQLGELANETKLSPSEGGCVSDPGMKGRPVLGGSHLGPESSGRGPCL